MKKKIITLCLVIALLSVAVIGGTLAYFTDEEQARNEFTIGNVEIDLSEVVGQKDSAENIKLPEATLGLGNDGDTVQEYAAIMPGDEMKKVITVENTGSEDAYIAISIKHELYRAFNSNIDTYYEGKSVEELEALTGEEFEDMNEAMQFITKAIWSGADWNLWYNKKAASPVVGETFGTRYYPDVVRDQQDGKKSYVGEEAATLIAVDYVVDQDEAKYGHLATFQDRSGYAQNMLDTIDAYTTVEDNNRMWVYYYFVPAGEEVTLDLSFTCPTWIDNNSINAFAEMILDIQAAAIQTSGFKTAEDAFQVVADQIGFATNG